MRNTDSEWILSPDNSNDDNDEDCNNDDGNELPEERNSPYGMIFYRSTWYKRDVDCCWAFAGIFGTTLYALEHSTKPNRNRFSLHLLQPIALFSVCSVFIFLFLLRTFLLSNKSWLCTFNVILLLLVVDRVSTHVLYTVCCIATIPHNVCVAI